MYSNEEEMCAMLCCVAKAMRALGNRRDASMMTVFASILIWILWQVPFENDATTAGQPRALREPYASA